MTDIDMTDAQRAVAEKAAKLLKLAGRNPNEKEAAAATAKAMKLLLDANLTTAQAERAGDAAADGRRQEMKQKGGVYLYQRNLWNTIAELNFCLYFTVDVWIKLDKPRYRTTRWDTREPVHHQRQTQHKLIGRQVNVRTTQALASYLEQVIDRLCRERLHVRGEGNQQLYSRWAVSFREGMAERIVERLEEERRREVKAEDKRRRAEAKKRMGAASTATALTIADAKQREKDLNTDFLKGREPGTTARKRAEDAAEAAREEAEYTAWAAAHPEEARAKEEEARKRAERYWARYRGGPAERDKDWGAYRDGYERGDEVSLKQQAESGAHNVKRIK